MVVVVGDTKVVVVVDPTVVSVAAARSSAAREIEISAASGTTPARQDLLLSWRRPVMLRTVGDLSLREERPMLLDGGEASDESGVTGDPNLCGERVEGDANWIGGD